MAVNDMAPVKRFWSLSMSMNPIRLLGRKLEAGAMGVVNVTANLNEEPKTVPLTLFMSSWTGPTPNVSPVGSMTIGSAWTVTTDTTQNRKKVTQANSAFLKAGIGISLSSIPLRRTATGKVEALELDPTKYGQVRGSKIH